MAGSPWTARLAVLLALAAFAAGCAAGGAFRRGEDLMRRGDLDMAVASYRKAVQGAPDNAHYKIALQRAMLAASRMHIERAKQYESGDQLEAALGEYRLASEYDPTNRLVTAKIAELDRTIRERVEATRPKPAIQLARERARAATTPPPLLNFNLPLRAIRFNNTSLREILGAIGAATGINITYDRAYQDRQYTVQLDGETLEQALNQILSVNQLSYKVLSERSILVFDDNAQKHAQYDDQVIQTFYLSNADATEMAQLLSQAFRPPGIAVQPAIAPNKTSNSITIRATPAVVSIFERIIQQNDKPRAEIVVDIEIMEVNRARVKSYGLNLSEYALGGIFSPEVSPSAVTTPSTSTTTTGGVTNPITNQPTSTTTTTAGRSTSPSQVQSPPPFNLNTITRGITTADFYMAVPTAIIKFLESDTNTKLVAKPQLRGAEGTKLTFKVGDQIPVISTSYLPIAGGGAGTNPLSSYNYKDVGVTVEITPRVTLEGDILLDVNIINNSRGSDVNIGGVNIPSFGNREVNTRLRLRDGESNLLAGLLREDERKALIGFPGAIHVPVLQQLFSQNDEAIQQTDVIMLLTPHVVRGPEITEADLRPIFIGSQQAFAVGGQAPLLAPAPAEVAPAPAQPAGTNPSIGQTTPRGTISVPPGATPIPGTVVVPNPAPPATQTPPPFVAPPPVATPAPQASPQAPPPATQAAPPPPAAAATPPAAQNADAPPTTSPGFGVAQVIVSPPAGALRVGQGPYNIPISITGAQRLSTVTLTITFDNRFLRVRTVQEGSFLRSGGANVTFTQQVTGNRIDITISRSADATGVSGTGLLAAILFDAVAPGTATLTVSGSATGPGNTAMGMQFRPVTVTVQ
jgi:type II secretory pathway component GspD/PulD (secretin)